MSRGLEKPHPTKKSLDLSHFLIHTFLLITEGPEKAEEFHKSHAGGKVSDFDDPSKVSGFDALSIDERSKVSDGGDPSKAGRFYAVFVGREVGVFSDR